MAGQPLSTVVPTDAELLLAQADLWGHSLYYLKSMALKCAVERSIPTAIRLLGGTASVSDFFFLHNRACPGISLLVVTKSQQSLIQESNESSTEIKTSYYKQQRLQVVSSHVSSVSTFDNSTEMYRVNALSYLLVDDITDDRHINHTSFVHTATSTRYIEAAMGLADWFQKDALTHPCEDLHGVKLFHESMEIHDSDYPKMANKALAAHDNFGVGIALREFCHIFEGLNSLTYCCGSFGDDTMARAIVKAFPHIKCTVLADPKVIGTIPQADGAINYVAGDMHMLIPPAQAVVFKLVLHHYNDEHCVKILGQNKKAIPSREDGGKVLIGDIMIESYPGLMLETHLLMDIGMMTMTEGRERDENEWRDIFIKAGLL